MGSSPSYLPGNTSARSFSVRVLAPMGPSSSKSQRFTSLPARTLRCPFSHRSSSLSLRTPSAPPTSSLPSTQARFHGGVSGGGGGPPRHHHKPDHHGKEGSPAFSLAALWRKLSGQEGETEDQKRKKEEEEREVDYRKEAEDVQEQNKQMRVITWVGLGLNILLGTGKAIAGTVSAAPSHARARGRVA